MHYHVSKKPTPPFSACSVSCSFSLRSLRTHFLSLCVVWSAVSCRSPIMPRQSEMTMECDGSHAGNVCVFACAQGTSLVHGSLRITCLRNSSWSQSPPICAREPAHHNTTHNTTHNTQHTPLLTPQNLTIDTQTACVNSCANGPQYHHRHACADRSG